MANNYDNSNSHKLWTIKCKVWLVFQEIGTVSNKINEHMVQTINQIENHWKRLKEVLFLPSNIPLRVHRDDNLGDSDDVDDAKEHYPEGSKHGNFQELMNLFWFGWINTNLKNMLLSRIHQLCELKNVRISLVTNKVLY